MVCVLARVYNVGGVMSPYTEAHFAAALLHCGPHVSGCKVEGCVGGYNCQSTAKYKRQVYRYFFKLFPEMVEHSHSDTAHGPSHEWTAFWYKYIRWVEA